MAAPKGTLYLVPNVLYPSIARGKAGPAGAAHEDGPSRGEEAAAVDGAGASDGAEASAAAGATAEALLPAAAVARIRSLRRFVVEGEKSAWRLLSSLMDREALASVSLERLDEHTPASELPGLLKPALDGEDIGLLSDAGVPCVADPGSALAALAHDLGIRVVPLVGPSSLILALSASGLDGQRFSFLGYLPQEPQARRAALASIDRGVRADGATRLFIETPYRNERLLADCLDCLAPDTRLCVARALTTESERVVSMSVAQWRREAAARAGGAGGSKADGASGAGGSAGPAGGAEPLVGKEPAVFLVGRAPGTSLDRPSGFDHSSTRICKNKRR